jgi:hypothetical protein
MINLPELVAFKQRERERELAEDRLARHVACHRACCNPSRLDRMARALGLAPAAC